MASGVLPNGGKLDPIRDQEQIQDLFKGFGVQVEFNINGKNVYKLNGKKAGYEEVWEHICKEKGFGYNLFD